MSKVDLYALPAPQSLERLDFATLRNAWEDALEDPDVIANLVPGDVVTETIHNGAYREMYARARINEQIKAGLFALSWGNGLDIFGAATETARLPDESDTDYRDRMHELSRVVGTGTRTRYETIALLSDPNVATAHASMQSVGVVEIFWTPVEGADAGEQLAAGLAIVAAFIAGAVDAEGIETRLLTDQVIVTRATEVSYDLEITLHMRSGPDPAAILDQANTFLDAQVAQARGSNRGIFLSEVYAGLRLPGVVRVEIALPTADLVAADGQAWVLGTRSLDYKVIP